MPFIRHESRHILFIHIPKTGGTTIETWLGGISRLRFHTVGVPSALRYTPQHFTYTDIRSIFGEKYFDYTFAVVRNPYERLASEYKMQYILGKQGFWKGFQAFPAWLDTVSAQIRQTPALLDNHLKPQWQFIADDVRVFKFEEGLQNIIGRVANEARLPPSETPLPRLTHSDDFDGVLKWDVKEIETVRSLYQRDFELFGYDMDKVPGRS